MIDTRHLLKWEHDYRLPAKADAELLAAQALLDEGRPDLAKLRINRARLLLDCYLSKDNMVATSDAAGGYVRWIDVLNYILY